MFQTNIKTHYFRNWFILPLFLVFCLLNAIIINSGSVHATASSISLSISGSPIIIVAPNTEGKFADSGNFTINITTTHASGYTFSIKATGETNPTQLNGANTEGHLASIESAISTDTFRDNSNYNDKWGYKPSVIYDKDAKATITNTNYLPSPSTEGDILDITKDSTDGSYTMSIGARVSTATAIDNYSNSFVFAVVGNPTPYAITYNKNTTDTVSNMPANHTTSDTGAAGESVTLASNTPTRTGYSFNGWCTVVPTTSGGIDSCTGTGATTYTAGGTWTIDQTSTTTNSLNLYAMWNRNSYNVKVNFAGSGVSSVSFTASGYTTRTVSASGGTASLMYGVQYTTTMNFSSSNEFSSWALNSSSYGTLSSTSTNPTYFTPNTNSNSAIITATGKSSKIYMQSMTASQCVTGSATTVYDNRDEQEYKVQRLADGKCWMLDNLRLDPANSTTLNNITASNTHASATTLNYFKNGGGTTSNKYPTAKINNVAWTSSSQDYYSIPMTINTYKDTVASVKYGSGSGKIGVYYNYCAASAGSYCYGNGTSEGTSSGNATEDLCPSGWRMPTGNTSGEYQALYTAYSSNVTNFRNALSTPLSGVFASGSADYQSSFSVWWASTRYGDTAMDSLYVNDSGVWPDDVYNRTYGVSLRCVAQ